MAELEILKRQEVYRKLQNVKSSVNRPTHSNLHGVDDDVDGGICDDEDVAHIGDDVLRHPEPLVAGELSQAGDQLL